MCYDYCTKGGYAVHSHVQLWLAGNWDQECEKWLEGRISTLALAECSREEVESSMRKFVSANNCGKHQVRPGRTRCKKVSVFRFPPLHSVCRTRRC